jgi:serine/threonine-protein kinase
MHLVTATSEFNKFKGVPMVAPIEYSAFLFGEFAVKYDFVTQKDIIKAMELQAKYRNEGVSLLLGEVLQDNNLLSSSACDFISDLQERQRVSINGYELISHLGKGGVGSVFKANQISLDRLVAIKLVDVYNNNRSSEAMYKEARIIAAFNHPNIVSAIDVGIQDGFIYLAMEFIDGPDLKQIFKEHGVFSEDECIEIGIRMGEALSYLDQFKCVHRDIKPGNILIDKDNKIKLIDLGLALNLDTVDGNTQSTKGVGTPNYISPEQAKGRLDIDIRSDIYALGATLYFLATGRNVFKGKDAREILLKHVREIPVNPSEVNKDLSPEFSQILLDSLEKLPENRPSPLDFAARLEALKNKVVVSDKAPKKVSRLRNRRSSPRQTSHTRAVGSKNRRGPASKRLSRR